jgi:hypothetical protein
MWQGRRKGKMTIYSYFMHTSICQKRGKTNISPKEEVKRKRIRQKSSSHEKEDIIVKKTQNESTIK